MSLDLTHIIMTVRSNHPEFSYEEIESIAQDELARRKKDKKQATKIKNLKRFFEQEFEVDMSGIDDETGWIIESMHEVDKKLRKEQKQTIQTHSLAKLPLTQFLPGAQKKTSNLIRIENLSLTKGAKHLFDDVVFNLQGGQKIALVGRNGIGKSTLLRVIVGMEEITDGNVIREKGLQIGYISQELFDANMDITVADYMHQSDPKLFDLMSSLTDTADESRKIHIQEEIQLLDGFKMWDLQMETLKYFGFTEDEHDKKLSELSGGQKVRIQLARCLVQGVDVLILDEPTNHLDIEGIQFLEDFCLLWNRAMICISHDRRFIEQVFDTILEISDKKMHVFSGVYQKYMDHKKLEYESALRKYEAQQEYLEKQNKYINKFRYKASTAASVQSRIKQLEKLEILEKPQMDAVPDEIALPVFEMKVPNYLMRMTGVQVGRGDQLLIDMPSEVEILSGQRIGIVGANGVGKTTLVQTMVGELKPLMGSVEKHEKVRVGYLSQITDTLDPEKTVLANLCIGKIARSSVQSLLASLLIMENTVHQKVKTLSGGERVKVALCQLILAKPHMIMLDEPTNHLDIVTKEILKKMLTSFAGTIVLVSHDRDFLSNLCDVFWKVSDQSLQVEYHL